MLKNIFASPRLGVSVVSVIVIAGFIGVVVLLLIRPVNIAGDTAEALKVLLGALSAKFGDVVGYHINSSSGSKAKDDILAAQVNQPTKPGA